MLHHTHCLCTLSTTYCGQWAAAAGNLHFIFFCSALQMCVCERERERERERGGEGQREGEWEREREWEMGGERERGERRDNYLLYNINYKTFCLARQDMLQSSATVVASTVQRDRPQFFNAKFLAKVT